VTGGATVRQIDFGDLAGVSAVNQTAGWPAADPAAWDHLWRANPAISSVPDAARGWVLLHDGRIVGSLINLIQRYQLGRRQLTAAVASSFVVIPEFRGSSLQLYLAFVRQRGLDLLLNTTAAPHVSQISEFLKFKRIPQPGYDRSYYWPLRPVLFGSAALRKKGLGPAMSALAGPIAGAAVALEGTLRGRHLPAPAADASLTVVTASQVDQSFDDLWQRVAADSAALLAVRDAPTIRWHFAERQRKPPPRLVCLRKAGRLVGYAAVVRQDAEHIQLKRARLADVFCEDDDPALIRQLLAGVAQEARRDGAAMLEVIGFPENVLRVVRERRPLVLDHEGWPVLYRPLAPNLDAELSDPARWRACLYDGDGSL
jgi:hypothetical protein